MITPRFLRKREIVHYVYFFELLSRAGIDSSDAPDDLLGEKLYDNLIEQSLLFASGLEYYESKICNLLASEQRHILNTSSELSFSQKLSNLEKIAHEVIKAKSKVRWDEINEQSLVDLLQVLQAGRAEVLGFSVHMLR